MRGGFLILDFITSVLDIKQEIVKSIDSYTLKNNTLVIRITLNQKHLPCPKCGQLTSSVKDYNEKLIKHALFNHRACLIHYRKRRYTCVPCIHHFYEEDPFTAANDKISKLTIMNILKDLKVVSTTFKEVAQRNLVTDTTVMNIFDTYVDIPRNKLPEVLCIDEIYSNRSKKNKYDCVLMNFETSEIIDVLPSRHLYELRKYFSEIDLVEREKVKVASIDMWDSYKTITVQYLKNAIICVDSFHVMKSINDALNQIRRRVMNKQKENSNSYYLLKKFWWVITKNETDLSYQLRSNRKLKRQLSQRDILNEIRKIDPDIAIAHAIKEKYSYLNGHCNLSNIATHLSDFLNELASIPIDELQTVYKTIKNWKPEIINSFTVMYGRRVSNGPIESLNGRIKTIKKCGNGFTNFKRFRNRVMYALNKTANPNLAGTGVVIKREGKKRGPYKKKKSQQI